MAEFPTIDEFAKSVAEKFLDDYMYEGKTIREWTELILKGDVVEVVRCRDCKYYKNGKHFTDIKFCQRLPYYAEKGGLNTADNDYCSYGERRSE